MKPIQIVARFKNAYRGINDGATGEKNLLLNHPSFMFVAICSDPIRLLIPDCRIHKNTFFAFDDIAINEGRSLSFVISRALTQNRALLISSLSLSLSLSLISAAVHRVGPIVLSAEYSA